VIDAVPVRFPPVSPPATPAPSSPPPLGLYIHIPWCLSKCPYCDFNSHALRGDLPEAAYLEALERDLEHALPSVWGRPVETVFLGGGTPSLLSPEGVDHLLTRLRTLLPLRPWAEITLEANPGTFEAARFRGFREAGVNRLSLGVQSFNAKHLQALGRVHDDRQAHSACEAALGLFAQVNLDLMYGLPGQTLAEARQDMEAAITLAPAHVSAYHLTLEPNTAFAAAPPPLPDDDLAADMQNMAEALLSDGGYIHYETSAFAQPGALCQHNLNYWQFGDYLGLGAGAHGKLSFHNRIVREARHKHPADYLREAGRPTVLAETRALNVADLPFEFMMNTLRLSDGFPIDLYRQRTGLEIQRLQAILTRAEADGLIERDLTHLRPSARGRRFLNELLTRFLP
jgi:oxygen-independent coproporphyrinogen-3 oxidase